MSTPDPATTLGTYQVVRPLAGLPFGRALLGADATGRAVVLTLVHPAIAAAVGFRERFAAEARMAAAAPLWFVAAVVDVDVAADAPWRAEVHIAGPTLQRFVDERGPLGEAGTAVLAERLARGLAALHAGGSAHGDLTPSTVVLGEDGPRLVGLGLVRAVGPEYGTAGYQAPEQVAAREQGAAGATTPMGTPPHTGPAGVHPDVVAGAGSAGVPPPGGAGFGAGWRGAGDVFALGCVLAFAATGRPPFAAGSAAAARRRVVEAEPDLAGMAEPVRTTVLACLRKDPAERPTASQVAAMLAAPAHQPTVVLRGPAGPPPTLVGMPPAGRAASAGPASARHRRSSRPWFVAALAAVAIVVVAAVVGAVALTGRSGAPPVPTPSRVPSATPGAAVPATGAPDAGTGARLVDVTLFGADGPRFTTPTHNIACQLTDTSPTSDGEARCDVTQHTWPVPPKPADCTGSWGGGASVSGTEQARLTCVSDTVADPGLRVLGYGQALSFGGIVCDSQETGVRCVNRTTGHGFRVARASYDVF